MSGNVFRPCPSCKNDSDFDVGVCDILVTVSEGRPILKHPPTWRSRLPWPFKKGYQYALTAYVCRICKFTSFYAYIPQEEQQ